MGGQSFNGGFGNPRRINQQTGDFFGAVFVLLFLILTALIG